MKVGLWRDRWQSGRNVLGATGQRQEGKQRTVRFPEPRERGLLGQRDDSMDKMCSVLMICLQFLIQNIFFLGIDSFILCVSRQLKSHIY